MITLHTLQQEALKEVQKFQEIAMTNNDLYRTTTSVRGPEETTKQCRRLRSILCGETHPRKFLRAGRAFR
jgi:hypothetical protein